MKLLINLPANTYTAKITYNGNNFFLKESKNVKITNLNQKGTFIATVNYAGNSYYNAKTVKTKITVN